MPSSADILSCIEDLVRTVALSTSPCIDVHLRSHPVDHVIHEYLYAEDIMAGFLHPRHTPMPDPKRYIVEPDGWQRWKVDIVAWVDQHPHHVFKFYLWCIAQYQVRCLQDASLVSLKYIDMQDPGWFDVLAGFPRYPLPWVLNYQ